MAAPTKSARLSVSVERAGKWVLSQDVPSDVVVQVGEISFCLHKFMLVAKCGHISKLILESSETGLSKIELPDFPGGPEIFEKAAKFCYGENFEITVRHVAALRSAGEYLEMSETYCQGNLISRTEDFLARAALTTFSGAVAVLKSCEELLPMAAEVEIVQRCLDAASLKVTDFHCANSYMITEVKGTFGYFDPEYFRMKKLTQKSDVYSFGVVLLESLCARPAVDMSRPSGEIGLTEWALSCQRRSKIEEVIDPFLKGKIEPGCLNKFWEITERCLANRGEERPPMAEVLWNLELALRLQVDAEAANGQTMGVSFVSDLDHNS